MGISVLLYGRPGTGKSSLAVTVPGPRLIIDSEAAADWVDGPLVFWTDLTVLPTEPLTPDTSVIVSATTVKVLEDASAWLLRGNHPFKSVILDSLSEMQKRFVDRIAGTNQMQQTQWGELLRTVEKVVRDLKDLKVDKNHPLEAIVMVCSEFVKDEQLSPNLQGALALSITGFFDLVGRTQLVVNEDQQIVQHVQILPYNNITAKDRTKVISRTFGPVLVNPNITQLIELASTK